MRRNSPQGKPERGMERVFRSNYREESDYEQALYTVGCPRPLRAMDYERGRRRGIQRPAWAWKPRPARVRP
jgi:hypothetical protein